MKVPAKTLAFIACLVAVGYSPRASAHVNVDARRRELEKQNFQALVDLNFGFSQGNINVFDLGVSDRLGFHKGKHVGFVFHESGFASITRDRNLQGVNDLIGNPYKNRHLGHVRYSYQVLKWLALEPFAQVQSDEFVLLRLRALGGFVGRFTLYRDELFSLHASTGYMTEYEQLDSDTFMSQPGSTRPRNVWHRWANALSYSLVLTENTEFHGTVYIQPRFGNLTDIIAFSQAQFAVGITKNIKLKLTTSIRHDTKPPLYCTEALLSNGACPGTAIDLVKTDVGLDTAFSVEF